MKIATGFFYTFTAARQKEVEIWVLEDGKGFACANRKRCKNNDAVLWPGCFIDTTDPETREYVWNKCKENYRDKGVRLLAGLSMSIAGIPWSTFCYILPGHEVGMLVMIYLWLQSMKIKWTGLFILRNM